MSKTILSFDVGIKNLAYCLMSVTKQSDIDEAQITVRDWDVVDLSRNANVDVRDTESLTASLLKALHERFDAIKPDFVIIENQPVMKNPVMKSVQVSLYTYFMMRRVIDEQNGAQVRLCSAASKLKPSWMLPRKELDAIEELPDIKKTANKYSRRKKMSVAILDLMFSDNRTVFESDEIKQRYEDSKKKDDLADSLLQAVHFTSTLRSAL